MFPVLPRGSPPPPYCTAPGPPSETQPQQQEDAISRQPEGTDRAGLGSTVRERSLSLSELEVEHFGMSLATIAGAYTTSQAGHALVAPAAPVRQLTPLVASLGPAMVASHTANAVVTVDPPVGPAVAANPADATLSHSVDVVLVLVKPISAMANKRKKAAAVEQKYGPIEVDLSAGFDGAWVVLAQLLDQTPDVFDLSSAEWRFMTPANSSRYPLRDANAFLYLAKQVHGRANLKTPKSSDISIYVKLRPSQVCAFVDSTILDCLKLMVQGLVQGSTAARSGGSGLTVAEINQILGAQESEGSDTEETSASASKKVSYNISFSSCILTYLSGLCAGKASL
jgi:hypothetical protein